MQLKTNSKVSLLHKRLTLLLICCLIGTALWGQEEEPPVSEPAENERPKMFVIPLGYDYTRFDDQRIHSATLGAGALLGEQTAPFTEVDRRFTGMAFYTAFFFKDRALPEAPEQFHQVRTVLDGRINRHQLLGIFRASADKPVAGGLSTYKIAAGYGYELIRQPHISLILGGVLGVGDFGRTLPSGAVMPLMVFPLIRFGVDTQWFVSNFDFLTGPNLSIAAAPKEKIRFTADVGMEQFRSINDIMVEATLWYRFFGEEHAMGDFAGIGVGFKNTMADFALSKTARSNGTGAKTYELQQTSIFAVLDLTILTVQGGWIFHSANLLDGKKMSNPGKGWYVSVQGVIPIG